MYLDSRTQNRTTVDLTVVLFNNNIIIYTLVSICIMYILLILVCIFQKHNNIKQNLKYDTRFLNYRRVILFFGILIQTMCRCTYRYKIWCIHEYVKICSIIKTIVFCKYRVVIFMMKRCVFFICSVFFLVILLIYT